MNGPHDMGGAHGFGPVAPEKDEPVFHADWERRALALSLAMNASGAWNIDMVRHARERIPPAEYLDASYYEKWLKGLEKLLVENGYATESEIAAGHSAAAPTTPPRVVSDSQAAAMLAKGSRYDRKRETPAAFSVGDSVRAKVINPTGHTRLPRYVRGRIGTIDRIHGVHVLPDTNSTGRGEDPQWLYSVRFDAREVFGAEAREGDAVFLDLWEPYLERA